MLTSIQPTQEGHADDAQPVARCRASDASARTFNELEPHQELLRLAVKAWDQHPSPARAADVLEQLERCRRDRVESVAAYTGETQGHRLPTLNLAALTAALRADEAVIEYGVLDDELLACVITHSGVSLHRPLAPWQEVLDAIRATRFQMASLRHDQVPVAAHLETLTRRSHQRLERLHNLLLAPLVRPLANKRRLLIVPCGPLSTVPFGALRHCDQIVSATHDVALLPSARMALQGLTGAADRPVRALALGATGRLVHKGAQAMAVAALFPQGQALVGTDATVSGLLRDAPAADVIHLACRAQLRTDNPASSALHLHDGALSIDQIGSLRLKPCIVVLSACETGLALQTDGEGEIGLVRAFLAAGASRVITNLWPVDDQIADRLMPLLYQNLLAGQAPATALRLAQSRLRQEHPHPFHWAAFAVYGGW